MPPLPTWGEILSELNQLLKGDNPAGAFDAVRRKYLAYLNQVTGRNVILYATKWTTPGGIPPELLSITDEDVHGMMGVLHGLQGSDVDLVLHSPGGSAEATEAIVTYLRSKFSDIRVIVPQAAMSAATMLACAANRIVLGKHSSLGPIDPQMILNTPLGQKAVPAQAILDQFKKAQEECKNPALLASWLPMLSQYGPALLIECENALQLSQELVSAWLRDYMFEGETDAEAKANAIGAALANHTLFRSHARHIDREQAKRLGGHGLKIEDLESDQRLQDAVLSVFHATVQTFNQTRAVKIIENHKGRAYVKIAGVIVVQQPTEAPRPSSPGQPAGTPAPGGPTQSEPSEVA